MRKLIAVLLVVFLLVLSSCSKDDSKGGVALDNNSEDALQEESSEEDAVVEDLQEDEPAAEAEAPEPEELDPSDFLVEKNVGDYKYSETKKLDTMKFSGFEFSAFQAAYAFGNTEALVSVMFAGEKKVNLFEFVNKTLSGGDYVLLGTSDFDLFEQEVYYSPSENTFFWPSGGNVVVIEHPIGQALVSKYMDAYPFSKLEGSYEDDAVIELEGEGDSMAIMYNDNQYTIELTDVDSSDDEVSLKVNDEKRVFELGDEAILGGLLFEVVHIDFEEQEVRLELKDSVLESRFYQIKIGEPVAFEMGGKNYNMEIVSANSGTKSVVAELNGASLTMGLDAVKSSGGLNLKLTDLFVSNIGEQSAIASIQVWIN